MDRDHVPATAVVIFLFACLTSSGCALTKSDATGPGEKGSLLSRMPWSKKKSKEPVYADPVKLAATWTPDTLTQSGRVPTRGFGARVFFYDEKSRPVAVNGTLVVHGFDEEADTPTTSTRRFEFTPEQFTNHYSQSELGASYSVWIPWDAVGGEQSRVSLVATFRTQDGRVIQGTPSKVLLPGRKDHSDEALAQRFSPQYRQWQKASSGELPPSSGLATTTITRRSPVIPTTMTPSVTSLGDPWTVAQSGQSTPSLDVAMRRPEATTPTPIATAPSSTQPTVRPASRRLPQP